MIIAIDGPAASGKGTLAKRLAKAYGLPHLDTGLLYRATAHAILVAGGDVNDRDAAIRAAIALRLPNSDDIALRSREMGEAASLVAVVPEVRAALLDMQRTFARGAAGAVLDGRDIGTVICPEADAKIFVTASAEARARRRALELEGRGEAVDHAVVLADIKKRDALDAGRSAAPLRAADDAVTLDTTDLDVEAAFAAARAIVDARLAEARNRERF